MTLPMLHAPVITVPQPALEPQPKKKKEGYVSLFEGMCVQRPLNPPVGLYNITCEVNIHGG